MRQGFSWTQLSVEGVRTGAVRDLFGVGKCHELAGFRGQLVRAWAWYRVAVRCSWSQFVGSMGHQLAGICHQLGQLAGGWSSHYLENA